MFKFCNGTVGLSSPRRLTLHHTFMHNPSSTFVLDFAGSGVVHLLGGMGGFFLSVFYKIEEHFENRNKKGKNTEKACRDVSYWIQTMMNICMVSIIEIF